VQRYFQKPRMPAFVDELKTPGGRRLSFSGVMDTNPPMVDGLRCLSTVGRFDCASAKQRPDHRALVSHRFSQPLDLTRTSDVAAKGPGSVSLDCNELRHDL